MDPHAVTACLPWSGRGREGENRKREREGDTFTTIVTVLTTATATYTPAPPNPSSRRGAPSQRNYAKSPTRKIRDTTSRRVPTCCIVISGNLPRTTCIRILGLTVRSRSWISRRRIDGSLSCQLRKICTTSRTKSDGFLVYRHIYTEMLHVWEQLQAAHFLSNAVLIYAFVSATCIIYLLIHLTLNIKCHRWCRHRVCLRIIG